MIFLLAAFFAAMTIGAASGAATDAAIGATSSAASTATGAAPSGALAKPLRSPFEPSPAPTKTQAISHRRGAKTGSKVASNAASAAASNTQRKAGLKVGATVFSNALSKAGISPSAFLKNRVDALRAEIKNRPVLASATTQLRIQAPANKMDWLTQAYARKLVVASHVEFMLADKLIMAELIKAELGADADRYYPKTLGLKAFLEKRKFVDDRGRLRADPDDVEAALAEEFPFGAVARPAVGVAPRETERGLFATSDRLVAELFKQNSFIYDPTSLRRPTASHLLGGIASGEAIVLQEDDLLRADAHKSLKSRTVRSARVHTYEDRVVSGAGPARWVSADALSEDQELRAQAFTTEFLAKLSRSLLAKQAWGIDLSVFENGDIRIREIVTNRGRPAPWSTYLEQPRVLGAYSRLWEERYGVAFQGLSGSILRHNLANYFPYWQKRIETAKLPWKKALALLPPVP